ncbi:hypothetical protein AZE42_04970 [Rhizopogon vesiculosus]|uniref:Uncharacterized protein n=1 Tax=Rhizopogon vesiculosus TaxID=180088 RepID=A0A1J8R9N8_9AGAM|nr:hypothetical protein AZE42_04970 [Rhizopogon vesiculosus]
MTYGAALKFSVHDSGGVTSYKPPSDTTDRYIKRRRPSHITDKVENMPRPTRPARVTQDSIKCERLCHEQSLFTRPLLPEIWLPSITRDEVQMSRPFSIGTTKPRDMMERDRISTAEQDWSSLDRDQNRERTPSNTKTEARVSFISIPQKQEKHWLPSPRFTVPVRHSRSSEGLRPPPPFTSRPIVTKKSFTFDDDASLLSPGFTEG